MVLKFKRTNKRKANVMDSIYETKVSIAEEFESKIKYFDVLGDSTRIQIIALLLEKKNKEMNVDELSKSIYLSRPAISHHLKMLKDCGMLKCRSEAQFSYYSINRDTPIWHDLCMLFGKVNDLLSMLEAESHE